MIRTLTNDERDKHECRECGELADFKVISDESKYGVTEYLCNSCASDPANGEAEHYPGSQPIPAWAKGFNAAGAMGLVPDTAAAGEVRANLNPVLGGTTRLADIWYSLSPTTRDELDAAAQQHPALTGYFPHTASMAEPVAGALAPSYPSMDYVRTALDWVRDQADGDDSFGALMATTLLEQLSLVPDIGSGNVADLLADTIAEMLACGWRPEMEVQS